MHNRVGLGTFPLAGVFRPIGGTDAERIVRQFLDEGGYYIDTAPAYASGEVEKRVGRALKGYPRDRFYVTTKGGKVIGDDDRIRESCRYADIIRECENSLRRLELDSIDLYMIHSPDPETPFSETMEALAKLKADGKIQDIAVSNVSREELEEYGKYGTVRYVENSFSMINRSISPEFSEYLIANGIGLIPYHLLEIGLLTGCAFEHLVPGPDDLRSKLTYWNERNRELVFAWVREELAPIARGIGITIGQLNIAWALSRKFIGFVLVGTTNPEYIPINLKANGIVLPEDTEGKIDAAYGNLTARIRDAYAMDIREFRGLNAKFY